MSKLILASDYHYRTDNPVCRIDDFQSIQIETLNQIARIVKANDAYIIVAGDYFHRTKELMPEWIAVLLEFAKNVCDTTKKFVYIVIGNHEANYHNVNTLENTNINILLKSGYYKLLSDNLIIEKEFQIKGFNFGENIKNTLENDKLKIAVLHKFISEKELPPWMKDKGLTAKELCETYNYDVFVTGDNHDGFVYQHPKTKQLVFNPGCITRQTVEKKDYKPRVYLFDTDTLNYETIYLPDNNPDVVRKVVSEKLHVERSSRIDSFIELLQNQSGTINFDFENNLHIKCTKEKIKKEVVLEINKILEECY